MEKKKLDKRLITILILLLIIIIELLILIWAKNRVCINNGISEKEVSKKQSDIEIINVNEKQQEDEYTELVGYGEVTISKNNPYLYLQNPKDNEVYLSFDILNNGELLYSSPLIEPGKMETFDIYSCLDAGKHTLIYSISSYDLESKEIYWSGIKQEQEILIK